MSWILPAAAVLAGGALALTGGCSRPELLVSEPVEITPSPRTVRFERAVPASGPRWELCFEFDPPGESRKTRSIEAVLLTTSGERRPLVDVEIDRRGENVVCQIGRVDAFEPGSRLPPPGEELVFESVELTASERLRVRLLRGGSVPAG